MNIFKNTCVSFLEIFHDRLDQTQDSLRIVRHYGLTERQYYSYRNPDFDCARFLRRKINSSSELQIIFVTKWDVNF